MQIKSRTKDYYDHIAHIYGGGGDAKVTYNRKPFTELFNNEFYPGITIQHECPVRMPYSYGWFGARGIVHSAKLLVVLGKCYLVVDGKLIMLYTEDETRQMFGSWRLQETLDRYSGKFEPKLFELCKALKAPVFMISHVGYRSRDDRSDIHIEGQIPNLGELKLPQFYPAEQLYQDIAYFIGNTVNDTPDAKPPVDVDDKIKIVQAGFDLKQSFRHRK